MLTKERFSEIDSVLKELGKGPVISINDEFIKSVLIDEFGLVIEYEDFTDTIPLTRFRLTKDGEIALKTGIKKYIFKYATDQSIKRYTIKHNTINTIIAVVALVVAIIALFIDCKN